MIVVGTQSGLVSVANRAKINEGRGYISWLRGWKDSGAWTGAQTIRVAWDSIRDVANDCKTAREHYLVGLAQGKSFQAGVAFGKRPE